MAELLQPQDVADGVRIYLAGLNPDVGVTAGVTPTKFPTRSINIKRTGGYKRDLVTEMVQISIDCRHATSEAGADALARLVDAQLYAGVRDGVIGPLIVYSMTTFAGPYDNPDPSNPSLYRSSATYQIAVRMQAI
jgi:hypothetical protein